jgi:hypothetical protein
MSYLSGHCPVRYGLRHGPWKTTSGPGSIEEEKTHDFRKYLKVFIVGRCFLNHHGCMECSHRFDVWNFHTIYVFLDNNFVIKETKVVNKSRILHAISYELANIAWNTNISRETKVTNKA